MNFRFIYSALALMLLLAMPAQASDILDVKGTLTRPGVKLLAVDVYATWCKPCMEAMPKWKALREKYHGQGLRVVMVHTQDGDEQCGKGVSDFADDVICDEKGYAANWLRVRDQLPAAFLWSWQGNLLVKSGHLDGVEAKVKQYFKDLPRVEIGAKSSKGKDDPMLFDLVRSELHRASKLTVVATEQERKKFKQLRIKSLKGGGSKATECKMGEEVSANSYLQATTRKKSRTHILSLTLSSVEKSCSNASITVPYSPLDPIVSVSEGVDKLLSQIRLPRVQMPGNKAIRGIKTAGFGGNLEVIFVPEVEALTAITLSFDISEASIDFLEGWQNYTDGHEAAKAIDVNRHHNAQAKAATWNKFLNSSLKNVPKSFQISYNGIRSEALSRKRQWSKVAEAEKEHERQREAAAVKYQDDLSKLNRYLKLKDRIVSPKQKKAYKAEFDAAYAPYLAEKERRALKNVRRALNYIQGMARIPAGEFWMGCNPKTDNACGSDEKPRHKVYLSTYKIDKTEVTAGAYKACVDAGACRYKGGTGSYYTYNNNLDDHPINYVNHADAKTYCKWLDKRLPTEAEWEKAARGTDGRKYPWGNETANCGLAWHKGCPGETQPVGSLIAGASPYGAIDMAGNVWEWTADWYGKSYYRQTSAHNPKGPTSGSFRVLRGGSFYYYHPDSLRGSNRLNYDPGRRNNDFGFRCAQ